MSRSLSLDPQSEFAFCENVQALPKGSWHIRKLGPDGPKFGGGAAAPLCYVDREHPWTNGWDLDVAFKEGHFGHTCPECLKIYKEQNKC